MLSGQPTSQPGHGRTRIFFTLAAAHLINDSYAFVLPALLPLLIPSLGISLTAAGLAVGLYQVTSSVTQPVLGHLADRYPLRWMAWLGLVCTAVGAGGIGVAPNYPTLLLPTSSTTATRSSCLPCCRC